MKIEVHTEGTQLKGVTFSHVDSRQEQESVERILAHVFQGENPVVALEHEQGDQGDVIDVLSFVKAANPTEPEKPEKPEKPEYLAADEREIRAFLVGYYVDENGLATDKNGKPLGEKIPGYFLREFKNRLVLYDCVDEDGESYLPLQNGKRRLYYDSEGAIQLMKEEIHKCQPINSLFAILTGMPTVKIFKDITGIDWKKHAYAVGKAILETRCLGRVFYSDPLYVQPIMSHKIQDYEDWAKLALETVIRQSVNKNSSIAMAYLLSDADVEVLAAVLNPQAWKTIFKRGDIEKTITEIINPAGERLRQISARQDNTAWQSLRDVLALWKAYKAEYPSLE